MPYPSGNRLAIVSGLLGGPVIVLVGYLITMTLPVTVTDIHLAVLLALPLILATPFLLSRATRPLAARFMIGAIIGTAVVVGVVLGAITLLATMLSDPASIGRP